MPPRRNSRTGSVAAAATGAALKPAATAVLCNKNLPPDRHSLISHLCQSSRDAKPGAGVVDRASTLRITGLKATIAGQHIFIKLSTNHGITAWGETAGTEPKATLALANSLFELLDGENPTRIEFLWQKLYRA